MFIKSTIIFGFPFISTVANFVNLLNADMWQRDANLSRLEFIATSF